MCWGMEFQRVGAEVQKALPPNDLCRGTSNRPDSEDLSVQIGVYWV